MKLTPYLFYLAAVVGLSCEAAFAQQGPAPNKSAGTPQILPRPDSRFDGNVGRTYLDSDPPQFPQPVQAPKGAPNIVLILIDDAGLRAVRHVRRRRPDAGARQLAAEGLRYTRFHTTALCSPTRAALLTGRNHHSTAPASSPRPPPATTATRGIIRRTCGTIAEVLRQNGYATAWFGKNHNTPDWETQPGRAVRPLAERPGLRLLLRLHGRRHGPVAADALREPQPGPASRPIRTTS